MVSIIHHVHWLSSFSGNCCSNVSSPLHVCVHVCISGVSTKESCVFCSSLSWLFSTFSWLLFSPFSWLLFSCQFKVSTSLHVCVSNISVEEFCTSFPSSLSPLSSISTHKFPFSTSSFLSSCISNEEFCTSSSSSSISSCHSKTLSEDSCIFPSSLSSFWVSSSLSDKESSISSSWMIFSSIWKSCSALISANT